jgi:hypothetical protein
MSTAPLRAADVQPIGPGEFQASPPSDAAPPELPTEISSSTFQAVADKLYQMGLETPAPQVKQALAQQGMEIDLTAINQVREQLWRKAGLSAAAPAEKASPRAEPEARDLVKVRAWAAEVGGLERLRALCDALLRGRQ